MEPTSNTPRPRFHFTSQGWINDPHAITFVRGRYHHFFQHVPEETVWGLGCSWGHASGPDLFSLEELQPALVPGEGDDGVWSGSLIVDAAGTPTIVYTSVRSSHPAVGVLRTATPLDDDWIRWEKGAVVLSPPADADLVAFRDPSFVRTAEGWHMIVGIGFNDGSAGVLGYASADGVSWQDGSVALRRPTGDRTPVWSGAMWECPHIVEVDGRHALIVSVWEKDVLWDVVYALGAFEDGVFTARNWGRLSHGPSPYAATVFSDADGRSCTMFWLRGVAGPGWAGAHSIPYRISIEDEVLSLTPHPDLDAYRIPLAAGAPAADIVWPATAENSLEFRQEGGVAAVFERDAEQLLIRLPTGEHRLPWAGDIRIILDGPVLEVCSRAGIFAAPITALGDSWTVVGTVTEAYGLEHR